MSRLSRLLVAATVGAGSIIGLADGVAHAATAPSTTTFPVFGSTQTVTLTTNPDGTVNQVALDNTTDWTAHPPTLHKVVFSHTGDTAKVVVLARNGTQVTSLRVATLADLTAGGSGKWSGQVFDGGDSATVPYKIGATAATPPVPTITLGSISTTGLTATPEPPTSGDHDGQHAQARVRFTKGDRVRELTITVSVEDETKGLPARLSVALGRITLDASMVKIGVPQTWNGTDCSGGPLSATYTVQSDGTVAVSSPTTGVITGERGAVVDFGAHVKLFLGAHVDGSTISHLWVIPMMSCRATDPAPTVNVTVVPPAAGSGHGDRHGDGFGGGMPDGHGGHS